jgi:tetratricopeptide (TPR) repeat protein
MKHPVLLFLLFIVVGCNSNEEGGANNVLQQAPYKTLTDSIAIEKNGADLYYKRGVVLLQNEQLQLAEEDMKKAWNLKKDEQYALGLAAVLRKKNKEEAISFLEQASRQLPQSIALKISLARGYQQKGDLDKAIEICNGIISIYPNQLDALQLKAELLTTQNKSAEALATLEQAYSYAPFDAELAHTLAFAYAEARNKKALSLSDSLIKADVQKLHPEPYYFKGVYYANAGNKEEALRAFDKAVQHDYNFLDAYMDKGNLLYNAKQYEEALKTFNRAVTVSPTFAEAYYWVGRAEEALGKKEEARLNYQRAYGLDKSLEKAREAEAGLKAR